MMAFHPVRNSPSHYGWVSIIVHWLMAIGVIANFFLGEYMVDLDYYDRWYHDAPDIHKQLGVFLGFILLFRFTWTVSQPKPKPLNDHLLLKKLAQLTHYFFYLALTVLVISGYLIATAKGKGIEITGLFELPALLPESTARADIAGEIHGITAEIFMIVVALHSAAALAHHFILRDHTLKRMLKPTIPDDKKVPHE